MSGRIEAHCMCGHKISEVQLLRNYIKSTSISDHHT